MTSESSKSQDERVLHFWVASYPFFNASLFVVPRGNTRPQISFSAFDADGACINEGEIIFDGQGIGVVNLENLLAQAKLESGLRHAHIEVYDSLNSRILCRLDSVSCTTFLGETLQVTEEKSHFFPITFSPNKKSFIAAVNFSNESSRLRCRLFSGTRAPDSVIELPPRGSRLISVESHFSEYISVEEGKTAQGYVRLGARGESVIGVQFMEFVRGVNEEEFYAGIA